MTGRVLYTKPSITEAEVEYAADAARNGWGARCYDYLHKFEDGFRTHLNVSHTIATSSCTGAMHMGLAALGVGPGDEIILADTNWIATVAPVLHLGATPVFVDIDPVTWCIDPEKAEQAITSRSKAIIATHLYGNLCNMDALLDLGKSRDLPVIEDAAEALGSVWRGRRAGSMGVFSTFSFHGTKTLTTGEGGIFATDDPALFEKVLTLSNHGRSRGQTRQFWADMVGFKYKMSNLQAAVGCAQLERIENLTQRKQDILQSYRKQLDGTPGITLNPEPPEGTNGAWMPTAVFDREAGVTRETLQAAFAAADIDARVFFWPLSALDMFEDRQENIHAWDIPGRAVNLPSYHDMTDSDIDRVTAVVLSLVKRSTKA